MGRCCACSLSAALFVRTFHTLIVVGVPASLVYRESSLLHKSLIDGQHVVLGVAYVAMVLWSLAMYYVTCFTDPGYILINRSKKERKTKMIKPMANSDDDDEEEGGMEGEEGEESGEESGHMMPMQNKAGFKYRVCDYCEIMQPMRAKHCEDCNKCVHKFDHHCPWLEACIGERNHRYFWLFLLSTLVLILCTAVLTWNAFVFRMLWSDWMEANAILFIDLFILLLGGMLVCGLFSFHSYLMFKGLTTWEAASRERITYLKYLDEDYNPFNEGVCRNLRQFLCVCRLRRWEKVYARKAKGINGVV
ncbi:probable palmitoyltransferase ZDHHC12 [Aplysia californica]|uniref:Palmitoyltransferase n=1 Tax=Aplysia californica TaxID=6500 RepID=A0ABM0KAH0_APLCA|nr:probable palmitoyltransferase ZDHHC12 [Aplysia californica]